MKQLLKSVVMTCLLIMAQKFSFSQQAISLSVSSQNDTVLVLSDGGITTLGNVFGRKVFWDIADPKIESFQIIPKFPTNDDDPFEDRPSKPPGKRIDSRVRLLGRTGDWYYSIIWKDHATQKMHTCDPKIAVKPITRPIMDLAIFAGLILSSILAIVFYNRWRTVSEKLAGREV